MEQLEHLGGDERGTHNIGTLGVLVRRFHAQVERQRLADEQLVAGLERVARDPRVRRVIKQICQESKP